MPYKNAEAVKKTLWSRYEPDPNSGCWLYTGPRQKDGYGQASTAVDGTVRVHRVSFEMYYGYIPDGQVLHACDTPCCINPQHLREGSAADNAKDAKKRGRTSHDPVGSRLAEGRLIEMIAKLKGGASLKSLALEYDITRKSARYWKTKLSSLPIPMEP